MTRIYDRDAKHYDRTVLNHLMETGQAQYYPAQGGIYVIKTEEGTVAVRSHQIIEITTSLVIPPVAVEATVVEVEEIVAPATARRRSGMTAAEEQDLLSNFF